MNVLDLFSGIGGFSLGLERAGMRTVAFCEIDVYCRRVLARHWPNIPCYDDIRTLTADRLRSDGVRLDVICGGFPCQDISTASDLKKDKGIDGSKSGLWREMHRIVSEVRPRYVVVENVGQLLWGGKGQWFARVLGDLASLGYDAEWDCIPAAAIGAPHRRDRVFIVAYPERQGLSGRVLEQCWPQASLLEPRSRDRFGHHIGPAWCPEPQVGLLDDGFPDHVAATMAIGNAVVPQIPEIIGRAIMRTLALSRPDRGSQS